MFARTDRLLLRPGWAEDAPELARAIADEQIVRNLATAPWPYALKDAEAAGTDNARRAGRPLGDEEAWHDRIARPYWGQGFATEAAHALIDIARTLKLPRLEASHFVDNPASGRVLEKLGFVPTGLSAARYSCARGAEAVSKLYRLRLIERQEAMAA
jgi:RimJ/RimL family protein N-acetyltransferase